MKGSEGQSIHSFVYSTVIYKEPTMETQGLPKGREACRETHKSDQGVRALE